MSDSNEVVVKEKQLKDNTLILVICAILLPPSVIFIKYGAVFSSTLIINIILCFFGWIPASIHSLYHIFKGS